MRLVRNIIPLLLILVGCTYSLERDATRCPPYEATGVCRPCWEGLTPGQSTEQDLLDFIDQNLNEKERDQALHFRSITPCRQYQWMTRAGSVFDLEDRVREIHVEQGLVSNIKVYTPLIGPTMRQVFKEYGPPEYVDSALAVGPDGQYYFLEVYYPSRGLAFELLPSQTQIGEITSDTRVYMVEYFAPGDLMSFLTTRNSCFLSPKQATRAAEVDSSSVRPWTGFGKVDVIEVR